MAMGIGIGIGRRSAQTMNVGRLVLPPPCGPA